MECECVEWFKGIPSSSHASHSFRLIYSEEE